MSIKLEVGQTADINPGAGVDSDYTYSSTSPSVVSVDADGVVTGVSDGLGAVNIVRNSDSAVVGKLIFSVEDTSIPSVSFTINVNPVLQIAVMAVANVSPRRIEVSWTDLNVNHHPYLDGNEYPANAVGVSYNAPGSLQDFAVQQPLEEDGVLYLDALRISQLSTQGATNGRSGEWTIGVGTAYDGGGNTKGYDEDQGTAVCEMVPQTLSLTRQGGDVLFEWENVDVVSVWDDTLNNGDGGYAVNLPTDLKFYVYNTGTSAEVTFSVASPTPDGSQSFTLAAGTYNVSIYAEAAGGLQGEYWTHFGFVT